ncbi:MAG: OB-fold domain-containing protein [Candidatus Peribacteraceae bacterium]|nr:OB-fold domain-containing protein [Candidatus Peribacteraceae bacterium]
MTSNIPALNRRIKQLQKEPLLDGTILSYTTIAHPPAGFGTEPYHVALIQKTDGTKVCAQLTGSTPPSIGAQVQGHMRRIRTLPNGLHVNDVKYEVMATRPVSQPQIQHYILALSGPSGVGKSTVIRSFLKMFYLPTEQVPIYTTCKKRKGETEPLVHISEKKFNQMIASGEIIAHSVQLSEGGQCGYRKTDIEKLWNENKLPVVVSDIEILKGLAQSFSRRSILSCGLLPPGKSRRSRLSALLHRLRGRGRETEVEIKERLVTAQSDMNAFDTYAHLFDHLLVNDKLDVCVETIQQLVRKP